MSMRLGYDLTIEQTQKLVMTPELIQAIQILQFNTQELDSYVQEQLLTNPVLEQGASQPGSEGQERRETDRGQENETPQSDSGLSENDIDWKEYLKERQYDDISYRQWEYKDPDE